MNFPKPWKRVIRNDEETLQKDVPIGWGYKSRWISVRTNDKDVVAQFLNLKEVKPCTWREGYKLTYSMAGLNSLFITPVIDGWTCAIGSHPEAGPGAFCDYMKRLSDRFGEAYYFGTHRIVGYQAWAIAKMGQMIRGFAYVGESGEFPLNVGERTADEIELNIGTENLDLCPDEEHILELASRWVFDPRRIENCAGADGPGLAGRISRPNSAV